MNVSHSVISQHIKNLENWLDCELFIRLGNRVELSEDGRKLQPQLANSFQVLTDACESILRTSQKGTLTVSAEPALASLWLRKKITEFCAAFPKIEIELRPAWDPPQLGASHADMIVHFETRAPTKGARQYRLFSIDGFPACARELLEQFCENGGMAGWEAAPLVHDNGREIWHQWFAAHEPDLQTWQAGRVYTDLSLAIDAAVDGEGVILADNILCRKELDTGALVKCDDRVSRCVWYSMAVARPVSTSSLLATFTSWVLEASADLW